MNQPDKRSVFWGIVGSIVWIGLPAFASLMFFGIALVTEKSASAYVCLGIVFGGSTIWAVYGVYRSLAAMNARKTAILIPVLTVGTVGLLVTSFVLSYDASSLAITNTGSTPISVSHGSDTFEVGGGQTWTLRYSVGDRLTLLCWAEAGKEKAKSVMLDREGPTAGDQAGPLRAEVNADGGEISFVFID